MKRKELNKKIKIIYPIKLKNMDSKIQLITSRPEYLNYDDNIRVSYFDNYRSVDSYKYNIIDLNDPKLWDYNSSNKKFKNSDDIKTLINAIKDNESKSEFIITIPIDLKFKIESFSYSESWLRNEPKIINKFLNEYFNLTDLDLIYGKNNTQIGEKKYEAGFHIKSQNSNYIILTKNTNDKITSVKYKNLILTTLQLTNRMEVINFINHTLLKEEIEIPDWFDEINMFDDLDQKKLIEENTDKIHKLETENKEAQEKLDKNNEYKSILYKQSKPLENAVKSIIGELLDYDLSDFEDIGHEDFLIELDDVTFIGEIKGTKKNITNNHLSKVDVHFTRRQGKIKNENLQPILIANRFIERPIENREPVNHEQIKCAETKYKCLIIDSLELLKLFEKFKKGEINTEEIKNRFNDEIGLFKL